MNYLLYHILLRTEVTVVGMDFEMDLELGCSLSVLALCFSNWTRHKVSNLIIFMC